MAPLIPRCMQRCVLGLAIFGLAHSVAAGGDADSSPDLAGAELFERHCLHCHDGSVPKAPHVMSFSMMSTNSVLDAMNDGVMRQQAAALTVDQRLDIARHLSGSQAQAGHVPPLCATSGDRPTVPGMPEWNGWGGSITNSRHQSPEAAGVSSGDLAGLELKWAFAYPGAARARSQPLVYGDMVVVGSQQGTVYALDLTSGCVRWQYEAGAEVRNGPAIATVPGREDPLVFFGDFDARVHGVSATTGQLVWRRDVATHPDATITGSVQYHEGRLYVPLSSSEWATAADPGYACCTFRGSVAALDAASGDLLWNSLVIRDEPRPTGDMNPMGAQRIAPAGAPIWNTPTIDHRRGLLYVGTGEAYTSPASDSSDAVVAMRLTDGAVVWTRQLLSGDAWNMACFIGGGGNCPEENGPDLDIGAATILWQGKGRDLLLVGQKSGDVYALDPDDRGGTVWHRKLGRGGFAGGVHWGMTASDNTLFVPIADTFFPGVPDGEPYPGLHALSPETGEIKWYTPATDACPEEAKPLCDPGLSAAATSAGDLVFAGGYDGILKAYDAGTGRELWQFNTLGKFQTVSGEIGQGGAIESDGPVVTGGHLLVNSGYQWGGRLPGNVLLVFASSSAGSDAPEGAE